MYKIITCLEFHMVILSLETKNTVNGIHYRMLDLNNNNNK